MKKQLEVNSNINFLDFDISNMSVSEFWVTIGDRLFFSQCHGARLFFSQNQSKEIFFSKKNPSPPPRRISNGPCLIADINFIKAISQAIAFTSTTNDLAHTCTCKLLTFLQSNPNACNSF